jgi:hypothetical protein
MLLIKTAFGKMPFENAANTRVCYNLSLAFGLPKHISGVFIYNPES